MAAISMDDRRSFANHVTRKFDKFWQWKLPCPVDPVADIYRRSYSDKEWVALRYLMQEKLEVINVESSFNLFLTDDTSARYDCPHLSFQFSKGMKLPEANIKLSDLPYSIQSRVRAWVVKVNHFRTLRDELQRRVKGVMGNPTGEGAHWINRRRQDCDPCINTPRQLLRLWPDIQPMMLSNWKRDCQQLSVKSRLPTYLGYRVTRDGDDRFCTVEEFRCKDALVTEQEKRSFKEINEILTMLSLADKVPHAKGYPAFCGPIACD